MIVRLARLRYIRLKRTTVWLVLLAGMGVDGAPVEAMIHPPVEVPPAIVRETTFEGDEAPAAPTRPMRALSPGTVRPGHRGLDAGTRSRSAGSAPPATDFPTHGPLRVASPAFVHENERPGCERAWAPSGIRGPPA